MESSVFLQNFTSTLIADHQQEFSSALDEYIDSYSPEEIMSRMKTLLSIAELRTPVEIAGSLHVLSAALYAKAVCQKEVAA
jgi:hypothetical protein